MAAASGRVNAVAHPARSRLAALTAVALVAASAGLLAEMNRRAHEGPAPAALTADLDAKETA
jgi:hypothetical protein